MEDINNQIIPNNIVLVGSSGEIGNSILINLTKSGRLVRTLSWRDMVNAGLFNSPKMFAHWLLSELTPLMPITFIFAHGQTNRDTKYEELMNSNYESIKYISDLIINIPNNRIITLGTISEHFEQLCHANPYLYSKWLLGQWAKIQYKSTPKRILHLRLHTIYGSYPKSHMFLGQMFASIIHSTPFSMSSGEQIREYQHNSSISHIIARLSVSQWNYDSCTIDINSGKPIQLRQLASKIFEHYEKSHLLKIGKMDTPTGENIKLYFPRSVEYSGIDDIEPITGIIQTFDKYA